VTVSGQHISHLHRLHDAQRPGCPPRQRHSRDFGDEITPDTARLDEGQGTRRRRGDTAAFTAPPRREGVLSGDDLRLYELIWKRTMASRWSMRACSGRISDLGQAGNGQQAVFSTSGKAIEFAGFRRA
jgi:DNA topoisomerase-1